MKLIPAIIQNIDTKQVLMLGYMSGESLAKTKATGQVWFYSRSRQRLWEKGETSGNFLNVVGIIEDCDQDALLITVRPDGPTCHTGTTTCFAGTLEKLITMIAERQNTLPQGSYTASLFNGGTKRIGHKVIEEAIEVVQAARFESKQRLTEESADLIYHLLVLLADQAVTWDSVLASLRSRNPQRLRGY